MSKKILIFGTMCIAIIAIVIFIYNNDIYNATLNHLQDKTDLSDDSTLANDELNSRSSDSNEIQWPLEIPSVVPKLSGIVVNITEELGEDQDKYVIYYKDIKGNSLKVYQSILEEKGWTINSSSNNKKSWQINSSYEDTIGMFVSVDNKTETGIMNIYLRDG